MFCGSTTFGSKCVLACNSFGQTSSNEGKVTKEGKPHKKPGPKKDPDAPHNAKINEIIERETKKGKKHIGGGRVISKDMPPEIIIDTPDGIKPKRRMDLSFEDPITGEITHYNVGLKNKGTKNKKGGPVSRENEALNDVKTKAAVEDRNIIFEPYGTRK